MCVCLFVCFVLFVCVRVYIRGESPQNRVFTPKPSQLTYYYITNLSVPECRRPVQHGVVGVRAARRVDGDAPARNQLPDTAFVIGEWGGGG